MDDTARMNLKIIGSTLGPLFLHDPLLEATAIGPLYRTLAETDPKMLAEEWPYVDTATAQPLVEAMVAGAERHCDYREKAAAEESSAPDDLTVEFRRLFVGPDTKAAAPWGSVYTDKDQVVFGESTLALRQWLRTNGISVQHGEGKEPEDHIGTMLVLLSWLADEKPEAIPEYLQDHLLPWAPHFLEEMESASELPFFQSLAALTRASLQGAQDALELEVEEPKFYR